MSTYHMVCLLEKSKPVFVSNEEVKILSWIIARIEIAFIRGDGGFQVEGVAENIVTRRRKLGLKCTNSSVMKRLI